MHWLARFIRTLAKLRFRLLGLATIKDVSGERFQALLQRLVSNGWKVSSRYGGVDAAIDYDRLRMRKGFKRLTCEWDNWSEWSVEGPRRAIEAIAEQEGLRVTHAWRWRAYDKSASNA